MNRREAARSTPDAPSAEGWREPASRLDLWIPLSYLLVAGAWIAASAVLLVEAEPSAGRRLGWLALDDVLFAAATALALHAGLRWALRRERRAREEAWRSARRYQLLAEQARDVFLFVRREDGRILDANAAAAAAYGWTREELRGLSILDLRAPGTEDLAASQMAEADRGGFRFETLHRRKDGTVFPVEVNSQGATVDGERVLVSVIRDATERRAAGEALRESEERLALAVEAAGIGLFHAVPYGPMQWSPRCREIFGVGDAAIPDFEAFLRLVHPDDRQQVRDAAARWTDPRGDGRYQDRYRCLRPDGSVRWIAASGRARFAEVEGVRRPVQLVGTVMDVTDVKMAQAQLMQADRLASVGMLAAGVAHEINNPLAYLAAALEYLDRHVDRVAEGSSAPRAEVEQALVEAREGAERVRHVVRDLRMFSGAREERRTRVQLERIVESAVHMAANEIRFRARLVRDDRAAPVVLADEARLGQVVLNLLINAVQAIPEGRAEENEIRVATGTDQRGWAVLEVSDTGGGIPAEIVDRIFDPFFTTKPSGVGTGLGLAICRSIVVGAGGEITPAPRPGGGTVMRVALPPAPSGAPAPATAASPAAGAVRRGRVLVVDDEAAVAAAVRRALAPEHEVQVCQRAQEALDAISRGERYDAILCDLMMPNMTGMDLYAALQRIAPEQAGRMVVLTGGPFTEGARDFLERSSLPRCDKPFESEALRALVRQVVR